MNRGSPFRHSAVEAKNLMLGFNLKKWNFEKKLKCFMCSVRRVLGQNFSPPSLFWKNDLEISKKLNFWL